MQEFNRPPALILDLQLTALATARCLADAGIEVHVASFFQKAPERWSRAFKFIDLHHLSKTSSELPAWIYEYCSKLGNKPVVFPTSDATALMLAKHRDELEKVCRIPVTAFAELEAIVSKERLYERAIEAGVNVPPAITEPGVEELRAWCSIHPGPYLVKPFYEAVPTSKLGAKNRVFDSANDLLTFVAESGSESLIIQRLIKGGDGWVFDCYGLCDRNHRIITQASHKRLRQFPRNLGTTCYGELPVNSDDSTEERIFEQTDRLLKNLRYHGIFGIEWVKDRQTGELFLLDFNARPFLSIGHLYDCGLNLPLHAYRELIGEKLVDLPLRPKLKHKFWIFFVRDYLTLRERLDNREIRLGPWLVSLLKARSFACWRLNDAGPSLYILAKFVKSRLKSLFKGSKNNQSD